MDLNTDAADRQQTFMKEIVRKAEKSQSVRKKKRTNPKVQKHKDHKEKTGRGHTTNISNKLTKGNTRSITLDKVQVNKNQMKPNRKGRTVTMEGKEQRKMKEV